MTDLDALVDAVIIRAEEHAGCMAGGGAPRAERLAALDAEIRNVVRKHGLGAIERLRDLVCAPDGYLAPRAARRILDRSIRYPIGCAVISAPEEDGDWEVRLSPRQRNV